MKKMKLSACMAGLAIASAPVFGHSDLGAMEDCFSGRQLFQVQRFQDAVMPLQNCVGLTRYDVNNLELYLDSVDLLVETWVEKIKDSFGAIDWLEKQERNTQLNDAQLDAVSEWIAVIKSWQKFGMIPLHISSPKELFTLGKTSFDRGMGLNDFNRDTTGDRYLQTALVYLIPYVVNYKNAADYPEVLFMLGQIRSASRTELGTWSEHFYLKQLIKKFPHTSMSWKAYQILEDNIHFNYSGSGGTFTPISQLRLLDLLKKLAKPHEMLISKKESKQ